MNQTQPTATIARLARSVFSRRGLRAAAAAGAMAAVLGSAGTSFASTAGNHGARVVSHVKPDGWAPTEECLTWSGTINYFPALSTTSKKETAVLNGTLSNCNYNGQSQTFSGTVFGNLTGTATKTGASLSGKVAVAWPSDSGLDPTIATINVTTTGTSAYSFTGTISAGPVVGEQLWGSYDSVSNKAATGSTTQSIVGSAPFALEENFG